MVYGCHMRDLLSSSSSNCGDSQSKKAAEAAVDAVVAVKVLPPRQCTAAEFIRELEMLTRCQHEYMVALKVRGCTAVAGKGLGN